MSDRAMGKSKTKEENKALVVATKRIKIFVQWKQWSIEEQG